MSTSELHQAIFDTLWVTPLPPTAKNDLAAEIVAIVRRFSAGQERNLPDPEVLLPPDLDQLSNLLFHSNNELAAAETQNKRIKQAIIHFMAEDNLKKITNDDCKITITQALRRSVQIDNQDDLVAALAERSKVIPMKPAIDHSALLTLVDSLGGDVPGAIVNETPYLIVKGMNK